MDPFDFLLALCCVPGLAVLFRVFLPFTGKLGKNKVRWLGTLALWLTLAPLLWLLAILIYRFEPRCAFAKLHVDPLLRHFQIIVQIVLGQYNARTPLGTFFTLIAWLMLPLLTGTTAALFYDKILRKGN